MVVVGGGELFSFLLDCESGINQYAGQKSLTDDFRGEFVILDLSCFRNILLSYHFRILLNVYIRRYHLHSEFISLVSCSVQYMKKTTLINIK